MGESYSREALINAVFVDFKILSSLQLINIKKSWKRYKNQRDNLKWDIDNNGIMNSFNIKSYQAKKIFNGFDIKRII